MSVLIPVMAVPSMFKGSVAETGSYPEKSAPVMVMLSWPAVKSGAAPPPLVTAS